MTATTAPQLGGLYIKTADPQIAFPLQHTAVRARVSGNVARVEVRQQFTNPFTTPLEATYIFPLPDAAAVDEMALQIGDRRIQGRIEKREVAQQVYEQAKQRGQTAGLLEQERPNIFTQSLANIRPGEQIDVTIGYSDRLAYKAGDYEFVFPLVVGPRYIPGTTLAGELREHGSAIAPMQPNQDTDLVPDASRLNAPILPPGARSGHDISLSVELEAGVNLSQANPAIRCLSHQIQSEMQGDRLQVTLAASDTIPNKDFILRYRVAGDHARAEVLTQADERGGHFSVQLIPAIEYDRDRYLPKDMVFLIDTSGSQQGDPLRKCQELMRRFITALHPQDTFNIVNFANTTQQLAPVPLAATPAHCQQALAYINRLHAGGGTEMLRGLRTVLNLPVAPARWQNIVLLTDGYIGNENQILAEVQQRLQPNARLHSFGAGSSVNRFLLSRVAELGRGISEVGRADQPTESVAAQFWQQINNPVLGSIQVRWEGSGDAPQLYPAAPPDLFAEQPLVLLGRKSDRQPGTLVISGLLAGGGRYEQRFAVAFDAAGNGAIAQFWGRARIKELMHQMVRGEVKAGVDAVTDTALAYQLLSQYTAFVAVSDDVRVEQPQDLVSTHVPVNMPEGVEYAGVFGTLGAAAAPMRMRTEAVSTLSAQAVQAIEVTDDTVQLRSAPVAGPSLRMKRSAPRQQESVPAPASPPPPAGRFEQPQPQRGYPWQIQVVSTADLGPGAIAALRAHLQPLLAETLPWQAGHWVFELRIRQGRVRQAILDEQASSLTAAVLIEAVRRSLLSWRAAAALTAKVTVTIQIQKSGPGR